MMNTTEHIEKTTAQPPKMDGFKQTEVGQIPGDWEVDEIQNLCKITTGAKNTQDKIENGKYPFFVRSQKVERINTYSFEGEAVLTAGDGVGTGKVFHYINGKFDFHQRVYKMSHFSERLHGYYFFQYFSKNFYDRIMQMTAKSSVDSVRRDMIAKMLIPLPPTLTEQRAIATALSDMDALIAAQEALITKKRSIKQGAMQELLKPKVGWEEKKLGDCLIQNPDYGVNAAAVKFSESLPAYLRITDITEDGRFSKTAKVSIDNINSSNYFLEKGDLVFARTGASVGKTYLYNPEDGRLVFAGFLIRVKTDPTMLKPQYFKYFTQTSKYRSWILNNSMRTGQPGINGHEIRKLLIALPSISEQIRIASILSDMDTEIEKLEGQLVKYREVKKGMMQELLTGKKRLIDAK